MNICVGFCFDTPNNHTGTVCHSNTVRTLDRVPGIPLGVLAPIQFKHTGARRLNVSLLHSQHTDISPVNITTHTRHMSSEVPVVVRVTRVTPVPTRPGVAATYRGLLEELVQVEHLVLGQCDVFRLKRFHLSGTGIEFGLDRVCHVCVYVTNNQPTEARCVASEKQP